MNTRKPELDYAAYLERPLHPPDPTLLSALAEPMDSRQALPPTQLDRLLSPEPLPAETGWCVLEDGAGYVSVRLSMPGVTAEMVRWWFVWHGLKPLRYLIWFPPGHYGLELRQGERRLLNEGLSMKERLYGVVHRVTEDVSGRQSEKPPVFDIHFRDPAELGFSPGPALDDAAVICAFPGPEDSSSTGMPALMCHVFRPVAEGVELRSRFWMGYGMREGKPYCALPPGKRMPDFVPRDLAYHCAAEYTNLWSLLPELYSAEGHKPLI